MKGALKQKAITLCYASKLALSSQFSKHVCN